MVSTAPPSLVRQALAVVSYASSTALMHEARNETVILIQKGLTLLRWAVTLRQVIFLFLKAFFRHPSPNKMPNLRCVDTLEPISPNSFHRPPVFQQRSARLPLFLAFRNPAVYSFFRSRSYLVIENHLIVTGLNCPLF